MQKHHYLKFISLYVSLTYGLANAAQVAQGEVSVYQENFPDHVVYHYTVNNNTAKHISGVVIGWDYYHGIFSMLKSTPIGWTFGETLASGVKSPSGWTSRVATQEEADTSTVEWIIKNQENRINPDQKLSGFDVSLTKADDSYLTSIFKLVFSESTPGSAPLLLATPPPATVDRTPPVLTVGLSKISLWPPNHKLVEITATISATDAMDLAPKVKLVSITCNDSCNPSVDIVNAAFGTDDRKFSLRANRNGKDKLGRVYTITYSATDAAGNSVQKEVTINVPHDQGH